MSLILKNIVTRFRRWAAVYRETFGRWYPAMTLVQVTALVEREARVEIEATAILP